MSNSTHLYGQLFGLLRQHSHSRDLRHLKALAAIMSARLYSGQLSLRGWEPYVSSRAQKAQSYERRWQRFLDNERISILAIYVPLVLAALSGWQQQRLDLALDTTLLWNRALHGASVSRMLRTRHAIVVAGVGAWQRQCWLRTIQGATTTLPSSASVQRLTTLLCFSQS